MPEILNGSDNLAKIVVGVDDAPENLILLKSVVRAGGYTFLSAKSGLECLSLMLRVHPRLILLDIGMPDLNGFETCRRLRGTRALDDVPIVFLTGRKTAEDVKQCVAVGGNDFIIKPFEVVKLLERIRYWTNRSASPAANSTASPPGRSVINPQSR